MTVQYYRKNVYGKTLIYAIDKDIGKLLTLLTGEISISATTIFALEKFGVEFEEVLPPK